MFDLSRTLAPWLLVGLSSALAGGSSTPDVLGDFSSVINHPGYLSFAPRSALYRGNLDLPGRAQGVPIEVRTPSRLLQEDFVDPATSMIDPEAVARARAAFAETHAAHLRAYCEEETLEDLEDDAPRDTSPEALLQQAVAACAEEIDPGVQSKWEDRNDYAAYYLVDTRLAEAHRLALILAGDGVTIDRFNEDLPDVHAFLDALFEALEVHEIVTLEQAGFTNRSNGIRSLISILSSYLLKHRIDADRPEAANLLVPPGKRAAFPGQRFFSPEQVDDAEDDPSLLDPPDSGFWRKPTWDIASFSTTDFHNLGLPSLRKHRDTEQFATIDDQAAAILDKDVPLRVVYEPDDQDGRTPKMTVQLGGQDWKLKYVTDRRDVGKRRNPAKIYQKRWQGSEVNVEPVVNNLAAAIGYTVDPTYYQEKVFVYFEDRVYRGTDAEQEERFMEARAEMVEELSGYFPDANVPSAFQNVQVDEDGRRYIEVRGATLEKKSDPLTDVNIGYFIRGGFGRSFKREFRAFGLYLAWIADPDIKDANVKAKLVPIVDAAGTPRHRLVYSASDLGGGLGTGLPNMYAKDLVKGVERDLQGHVRAVELTYRSIFPAPLLASATLSDARWIGRMIGQLTHEQIADAFRYAGFPEPVALYYTEVMLRRRDQLLEAVGLMGEEVSGPGGRTVRLEPLSRIRNPRRFAVEGYEDYFRHGYLRDPENDLSDSTGYFPRYWGAKYPWVR